MDSNKDEAERCIELAERYLSENKFAEAEKFLRKAQKLYPSKKVDDLLAKVTSFSKQNQSQPDGDSEFRRRSTASNKENVRPQTTTSDFTKDQLEAVKRVKKCKNYYEMLEVTKEATDSEIKRSYKKLALQLHPDKNKAPGSAEAFKVIGNAVAVLVDVEKRKQYDLHGCDEERMRAHTRSEAYYDQGRRNEAEELFNIFFERGFSGQDFYMRRTGTRWTRHSDTQSNQHYSQQPHGYTSFLQMLPVLLLIVLTMMSSFFLTDPIYSLEQSSKYTYMRQTRNLKVPYFVKDYNFQSKYQHSINRLEQSVEEDYVEQQRYRCLRERHYRESQMTKAQKLRDVDMHKEAMFMELPSCKRLQELYNV